MSVWRGDDAGAAFTKSTTFSQRPAAYSDLVPLGPHPRGRPLRDGPVRDDRVPPPAACRLPLSGLLG
ncbi:hypothetical protein OG889_30205 [Streptomyces sp. NBC_00481]|uniref:hypothetical protein n=1 Tax=Streptomyces sp. NBC_00481 TaxID=2975755 RepID=UPI002DDA7E07|nr:hypothetical protein [Streptomyces sp. NBC_00481]WRY98595.1 hypothetical protein OG889_30205 [Streptomyces sp. NBC_00481]